LKLEPSGKLMAAPIGVDPLESIETNGVTSTVGDDTVGVAAVASCALAGAADIVHASATIVKFVNVNAFIGGSRYLSSTRTLSKFHKVQRA
jgi:hypothetical protein